jgi:hypothetical protein
MASSGRNGKDVTQTDLLLATGRVLNMIHANSIILLSIAGGKLERLNEPRIVGRVSLVKQLIAPISRLKQDRWNRNYLFSSVMTGL